MITVEVEKRNKPENGSSPPGEGDSGSSKNLLASLKYIIPVVLLVILGMVGLSWANGQSDSVSAAGEVIEPRGSRQIPGPLNEDSNAVQMELTVADHITVIKTTLFGSTRGRIITGAVVISIILAIAAAVILSIVLKRSTAAIDGGPGGDKEADPVVTEDDRSWFQRFMQDYSPWSYIGPVLSVVVVVIVVIVVCVVVRRGGSTQEEAQVQERGDGQSITRNCFPFGCCNTATERGNNVPRGDGEGDFESEESEKKSSKKE